MASADILGPLTLSDFPLGKPVTPEKIAQYNDWHYAQRQGVELVIDRTKPRDGEPGVYDYHWPSIVEDDALVRALLKPTDPDFKSPSTWVLVPQYKCLGCDKLSGFADSVYTALTDGIHPASFMINAIMNNIPNKSPPRYVKCAGCGAPSPYMLGWSAGMGWQCKEGELADKC